MSAIEVELKPKGCTPIFDLLEEKGYSLFYECKSGYCGNCKVKLIKGDIKYFIPIVAVATEEDILTCCSYPTSDIVVKLDKRGN